MISCQREIEDRVFHIFSQGFPRLLLWIPGLFGGNPQEKLWKTLSSTFLMDCVFRAEWPESQRLRNHKSLATAIATQKNHCDSDNTLWSQLFGLGNRQFVLFFIVFQKRHMGLETHRIRCDYKMWFWIAAIFFAQCDFCDCDTTILVS